MRGVIHFLMFVGIWTPSDDWDGSGRRVAQELLSPVVVIALGVVALQGLRLLAAAILS